MAGRVEDARQRAYVEVPLLRGLLGRQVGPRRASCRIDGALRNAPVMRRAC
jgi:hypothetical protein